MPDFDTWLGQAWDDHAADADGAAAAVAARLEQGLALADSDERLGRLSTLAQHLHGEHLGQWEEGLRWQQALSAHPHCGAAASQAQRVCAASLKLAAGGTAADIAGLPPADRVRAAALAASALASRDTPRAALLLDAALAEADALAAAQADAQPPARALAVTANNLACALEDKVVLTAEQRALMLRAAHAARRWWAVAGGWLETERAEYRLAMCHLKAGDAAAARRHAQLCLEIVEARAAPPLEHFFGWAALALATKLLRDVEAHAKAQKQALLAFDALPEAQRASCRETLDRLDFGRG